MWRGTHSHSDQRIVYPQISLLLSLHQWVGRAMLHNVASARGIGNAWRAMGKPTWRVALAVTLGALWSLVWFKAFGALAIAPGVALAALVFLRPLKGVMRDLRRT
jgi:hypothetical protein